MMRECMVSVHTSST